MLFFFYNDFVSLSHHTEGKEANSKSEEEEKVYHPMIKTLQQDEFLLKNFCYKGIHSCMYMYTLAYCTVHACEKLAWDNNVVKHCCS